MLGQGLTEAKEHVSIQKYLRWKALSCASPTKISRMGMILHSDERTDINSLIKSWLMNQPPKFRNNLENSTADYFEKALQWDLKQGVW